MVDGHNGAGEEFEGVTSLLRTFGNYCPHPRSQGPRFVWIFVEITREENAMLHSINLI